MLGIFYILTFAWIIFDLQILTIQSGGFYNLITTSKQIDLLKKLITTIFDSGGNLKMDAIIGFVVIFVVASFLFGK